MKNQNRAVISFYGWISTRSQKEQIIPRGSWGWRGLRGRIRRSIREQSIRTEVNSKLLINASLARRSDERGERRSRIGGWRSRRRGGGKATSFNLEGKKVGWYLETRICKAIAARIIEALSYILFPFSLFFFLSEIFVSLTSLQIIYLYCIS